ncbi:MAG: YkvA family protein [Xenococcaceae cyanobacterium MO_188.B19]|nr:YkvA family protein [Xenococcaceae cyanobacterium MO_188.B19]
MKISLSAIYNWYRTAIRHPKYGIWVVVATLVYLVSPIDLSPDIFPIAGQIDDFILFSLLMTEVSQIAIDKYRNRKQEENTPPSDVTVEVEAETVSTEKV